MKILVTGANGKLGRKLVDILSTTHEVIALGGETSEHLVFVDITHYAEVNGFIEQSHPDLVINVAAWTDVEGCARDLHKAVRINGLGAQNLAVATAHQNIPLLQVSTNEVFDGTLNRPYLEYDRTHPINPYGYSKWVAEQALVQVNPKHYIVRTAWLFAHGGKNFIHAILNTANAKKPLRVVVDEVGNPTYSDDVAVAISQLIETGRFGIYHFVNHGTTSRYDFARHILDHAGHTDTPIAKISSKEWQRLSTPPTYATLENMAGASLGITLRPWQEAVVDFLKKENLFHG